MGSELKDKTVSYRPICLCSTIGNTLERIINIQLAMLVNKHGALKGFQRKRSTVTNLIVTENHLRTAANAHEPLDIISFDFSRTFDRAPHNLLLAELSKRGVSGAALRWLESFLAKRIQRVHIPMVSLSCISYVRSNPE